MEKLKLKKEQFELLSPFEQHFKTAKGDYVRGLYARDVEKMQLVYNQCCLSSLCAFYGQSAW